MATALHVDITTNCYSIIMGDNTVLSIYSQNDNITTITQSNIMPVGKFYRFIRPVELTHVFKNECYIIQLDNKDFMKFSIGISPCRDFINNTSMFFDSVTELNAISYLLSEDDLEELNNIYD